jgi:hypothetical protein
MRVILVIALLAIAGCASNQGLSGKHSKNSSVMRYERFGTATSYGLPGETKCGSKQVQWCTSGSHGETCKCVYAHEASDRVRRMADQLKRAQFPN